MRSGLLLLLVLSVFCGCSDMETGDLSGEPALSEIPLDVSLRDDIVVVGGDLILDVRGAGTLVPSGTLVELTGTLNGNALSATINAAYMPVEGGLEVVIGWDALDVILGASGDADFIGTIRVEVPDLGAELVGVGEVSSASVGIRQVLDPDVDVPGFFEVFANDLTTLVGVGALRPSEGTTELIFEGEFIPDGGAAEDISGALPVTAGASRGQWQVAWPVSAVGIRPGTFTVTATPTNTHRISGEVRQGQALPLQDGMAAGWPQLSRHIGLRDNHPPRCT